MSTMVGNWKMAIADGCGPGGRLSLFNLGSAHAHVELTFCAEGGRPLGPFHLVVPPRHTLSPRLEDLAGTALPPSHPPYSAVVVSDAPLIVQPRAEERQEAA